MEREDIVLVIRMWGAFEIVEAEGAEEGVGLAVLVGADVSGVVGGMDEAGVLQGVGEVIGHVVRRWERVN